MSQNPKRALRRIKAPPASKDMNLVARNHRLGEQNKRLKQLLVLWVENCRALADSRSEISIRLPWEKDGGNWLGRTAALVRSTMLELDLPSEYMDVIQGGKISKALFKMIFETYRREEAWPDLGQSYLGTAKTFTAQEVLDWLDGRAGITVNTIDGERIRNAWKKEMMDNGEEEA